MKKCTGNNTHEWGPDAIFDVACKHCGQAVEFFKDEISRNCRACGRTVVFVELRTHPKPMPQFQTVKGSVLRETVDDMARGCLVSVSGQLL